MNSMTGFGKAEKTSKLGRLTVEITSVNNRFLEISPRMPRRFFPLEPRLKELVGKIVNRGKVTLFVGFDESDDSPGRFSINSKAIKAYHTQLVEIKKNLKLSGDITIHDMLLLPDIAVANGDDPDIEQVWADLEVVIRKALQGLVKMRKREGGEMAKEMRQTLKKIATTTRYISANSKEMVTNERERLSAKVAEMLAAPLSSQTRLEEELAIFADKVDIAEECTRLLSHLVQYSDALKAKEPVGKRINFILQEMNREANTIGSKCTDIAISRSAISIKEDVEKLRELVQNVE